LYLLSQQFVAECVERAYLACEDTARDETVTGKFDADDWK